MDDSKVIDLIVMTKLNIDFGIMKMDEVRMEEGVKWVDKRIVVIEMEGKLV